ncbi:hypothetical protein CPB83DRAFT_506722 [Crepidotus variabilis]|uniref:XPG-I domain-containing protein n=1 Tax=Crepidotus variabilis TaxID=179855 RepID=A0A9P6JM99_9AGAR|nr:hypothetical protein CPB83DRAFT_506722 [Crepidotus variabilis]
MGVAGLWDVLKPAGVVRSLTDLAIKDGFQANPDKKRGFRLGIDASIWFFHAEYGREGENPVLRTLFFRCATLMHTTFLPLFVFDGPKRPDFKRGKKINKAGNALIPGMKNIVEAFGFEWRMAPGEAEAELAYLNRIGIIDGVLSDDVDNFLFGAKTVLRNSSNTLSGNRANPILNSAGKDDKNHSRIFKMEDITNHPDIRLTQGGLILIGLMSGGDYQQGGLMRCGVTTAAALARCGFGDTLYEAAMNLERDVLLDFLVMWREELKQELKTNSKGEIGRKQAALAKSIPDTFPNIDVLLSYVKPITSQTMGRESNNVKITWGKEPDVAKLAGVCEMYFEWGYKEAIMKRFRTVMWHSVVLRILRRAVLDLDERGGGRRSGGSKASNGSKVGKAHCGTPSKMIAKHFASLELASPSKVYISGSESEEEDEHRLIIKIHSAREHPSTDGLPEYRLEVAPKQLVELAESGIEGRRAAEGPDEWASEGEDDDDGSKKKGKKEPVDPESHLRLWMPACMVKLVEPGLVRDFEDKQEQKRLKKVKKSTKGAASTGDKDKSTSRRGLPSKPASTDYQEENDPFTSSARPEVRPKVKAKSKPNAALPGRSQQVADDDDELPQFIAPRARKIILKKVAPRNEPPPKAVADDELGEYDPHLILNLAPTCTTRSLSTKSMGSSAADIPPLNHSKPGIRDLTKKKNSAPSTATGLKSFFATTKSSMITTGKTALAKPTQNLILGRQNPASLHGTTKAMPIRL